MIHGQRRSSRGGRSRAALILSAALGIACLVGLNMVSKSPAETQEEEPSASASAPAAEPSQPIRKTAGEEPPDYRRNPNAAYIYVDRLIRRTRGDHRLLSPREKRYVEGLMAGRAQQIFRERYQQQREKKTRPNTAASAPRQ